jgi:hypothetical protein
MVAMILTSAGVHDFAFRLGRQFFVFFLTELTPGFIKLYTSFYLLIMPDLSIVYHSVVGSLLKGHCSEPMKDLPLLSHV